MTGGNAVAIAQALVDLYGREALAILEERMLQNIQAGEPEAAALWRSVGEAAQSLLRDNQ